MLQPNDPASSIDLRRRAAARLAILAPAAISLAASLIHGPGFLDDAFITFRFAENLARGRGLVFNPGEPVLGTTTPLFALVLGALKLAGLDVPSSARAIGVVMTAVTAAIASALALKRTSPLYAGLAGIGLAVQPLLPFIANSGMETGPYMAFTFGALLAATGRRFWLAGVLCGLTSLTRPDGAVAALVCLGSAGWVDRRSILKVMIPTLAICLPWIIFASLYYGSPLPHSILAKRLIHPEGPLRMLAGLLIAFNLSIPMLASTILGLIGFTVAARKRGETLILAAWTALYLLGLIVSGVKPLHFMWYLAPFAPGVAVFSALGAKALADRLAAGKAGAVSTRRRLALLGPVALLSIALVHPFTIPSIDRNFLRHRHVSSYLKLGEIIAGRGLAGDKVLVGEVGAMSYAMMDQYVIDSSGINSPRVHELRLADKQRYLAEHGGDYPDEGTTGWVRATIEEYQPRYICAYFDWLHINEIIQEKWFSGAYRRVELSDPALVYYPLFERIADGGEDFIFRPPRVQ